MSLPLFTRSVLAHEIGQVRDVIRQEPGAHSALTVYPTIQAAVDALLVQ
jgi:hypothetical protein